VTKLLYDGNLIISTGISATAASWTKTPITWQQFVDRLAAPKVTWETKEQFHNSTAKLKTKAKDVGGYVGGVLQGEKRKKDNVLSRQLITLDLDGVENIDAVWSLFQLVFNCAGALHTTHSHLPKSPRARLIVPLVHEVSPKSYMQVSQYIASQLGLGQFDPTTHEPNRLMFWPSVCADGFDDYVLLVNDEQWLDEQTIINTVKGDELNEAITRDDPTKIPGLVGSFNRAYPIAEAIEAFIPDVYTYVSPGRFKLAESDSQGGLVVYDGGKYCYSHHANDPVQGKVTHSYDLICAHKFEGNTTAMQDWIIEDKVCPDSAINLTLDKKGKPESTVSNMRRILNTDPDVADAIALDDFANKLMVYGDFPWLGLMDRTTLTWSDTDDSGLREFFETKYGMVDRLKIQDALALTANQNKIHPVRKYLTATEWDGTARAETLLIDFLGADDTPYVRAVTRKALLGAVARIMIPGCKHDHVLVLVGPQGCRKSTTIGKLGNSWYTDSLYTMQGKEAYELIQGYWIIEISEMAAARKSDIEQMKQFISKQTDNFRAAYDRRTLDHPRQCAFFGSTNDEEFLRDYTGNRRFWPVNVRKVSDAKYEQLNDDYIKQIWAEMVYAFKKGEKWYLDEKMEAAAQTKQEEHLAVSPFTGSVLEFVENRVPKGWNKKTLKERVAFYSTDLIEATEKRDRICAIEIWVECLGGNIKDFNSIKAREINNVLRRMPGWIEKQLRFNADYGAQRGFERFAAKHL
jgi:predicted P-loop ATPase